MLNLRAALVEPDATLGSADGARGAKMSGIRFVAGAAEEFGGSFGSASGGGYDDETDGTDGDSGTGHEMDVVAGVEEDGQLDSVVHLAQGSEA
ncbi:hypothetical protein PsYK624_011390 [Phanerochaete sordida]|uniref:Uncharacterized protein n=1 Tax=Phanerochaete sordida TaxID=48140 RepID=A0A9P3L8V2_9APHY|nr:hypothetical protein PsYK624_011390 [Phanerochaete sordida]